MQRKRRAFASPAARRAGRSTQLEIPYSRAVRYRSQFGPSLLDHCFEASDTVAQIAKRTKRDEEREDQPLVADSGLLKQCQRQVEGLLEVWEAGAPPATVAERAEIVAANILDAARADPDGIPDYSDVFSQVADLFDEEIEIQFADPDIWTAQSLLYARSGELRAAQKLTSCTLSYLSDLVSSGHGGQIAEAHLSVAFCAKAELAHKEEARLVAVRQAWEHAREADAASRRFVAGQYRRVLEDQQRPKEVIEDAAAIERELAIEAGDGAGRWILEWI